MKSRRQPATEPNQGTKKYRDAFRSIQNVVKRFDFGSEEESSEQENHVVNWNIRGSSSTGKGKVGRKSHVTHVNGFEEFQKEFEWLIQKHQSLQTKYKALEAQCTDLKASNRLLTSQNKEAERDAKTVNANVKRLGDSLSLLESEVVNRSQNSLKQLQSLTFLIGELKNGIKTAWSHADIPKTKSSDIVLSQIFEDCEKAIYSLQREFFSLETSVNESGVANINNEQNNSENDNHVSEALASILQKENLELRTQIRKLQLEASPKEKTAKSLENLKREYNNLQQAYDRCLEHNNNLKGSIIELRKSSASRETQLLVEKRDMSHRQDEELGHLKQLFESKSKELESAQNEIRTLQLVNREATQQIESLTELNRYLTQCKTSPLPQNKYMSSEVYTTPKSSINSTRHKRETGAKTSVEHDSDFLLNEEIQRFKDMIHRDCEERYTREKSPSDSLDEEILALKQSLKDVTFDSKLI
eukprot:Nk52_evm119s221 gene=Nk52_evmTU119s221